MKINFNDDKYHILVFCGPSGAGKDTCARIAHTLVEKSHFIVSSTTRDMRDNEIQNEDYHFISTTDFAAEVMNGNMIEASEFNGWFYGTNIKDLKKNVLNIGVYNPEGIKNLLENPKVDIKITFISRNAKMRLLGCLNREDHPNCDEICRRFISDKQLFKEYWSQYKDITNVFPNNYISTTQLRGALEILISDLYNIKNP